MYSNFKEQAIEYVRQAVEEDKAGNYAKAFPLYMNALEYFKTHLKYEKNPKIKDAITQKFTEYLRRAEEIRAVLDDGGPGPASSGDAAVATRPKSKPKNGESGGDGEDAEQAKLRAGLNSAIIREKPNVQWNDVAGLESAKQALQEAVILPVKFPQFFTGMQGNNDDDESSQPSKVDEWRSLRSQQLSAKPTAEIYRLLISDDPWLIDDGDWLPKPPYFFDKQYLRHTGDFLTFSGGFSQSIVCIIGKDSCEFETDDWKPCQQSGYRRFMTTYRSIYDRFTRDDRLIDWTLFKKVHSAEFSRSSFVMGPIVDTYMLQPSSLQLPQGQNFPTPWVPSLAIMEHEMSWGSFKNFKVPGWPHENIRHWVQHIIRHYKDRLSRVGLFEAVSWAAHPPLCDRTVYQAMLELFSPYTNTCFTPVGEMGFSLYEISFITGLPIDGQLYEEFIPSSDEIRTLPPDVQTLFNIILLRWFALSKYPRCENRQVLLSTWASSFSSSYNDSKLFQGQNLLFDNRVGRHVSILSFEHELLDLVAFLVGWLSVFIFPQGDSPIIRPETIFPAVHLVIGQKLSLCPALVARLCSGLRAHIYGGEKAYPSLVFYCWFCFHCSGIHPIQSNTPSDLLFVRQLKNKGIHFTAESIRWHLRDWKHYQHVRRIPYDLSDIERDHGRLSRDIYNYIWLRSIRPSTLVFRSGSFIELEPYYPSRFASQLGYSQGYVGSPRSQSRSGNMLEAYFSWMHFSSHAYGASFSLPHLTFPPIFTQAFCSWYSVSIKQLKEIDPKVLTCLGSHPDPRFAKFEGNVGKRKTTRTKHKSSKSSRVDLGSYPSSSAMNMSISPIEEYNPDTPSFDHMERDNDPLIQGTISTPHCSEQNDQGDIEDQPFQEQIPITASNQTDMDNKNMEIVLFEDSFFVDMEVPMIPPLAEIPAECDIPPATFASPLNAFDDNFHIPNPNYWNQNDDNVDEGNMASIPKADVEEFQNLEIIQAFDSINPSTSNPNDNYSEDVDYNESDNEAIISEQDNANRIGDTVRDEQSVPDESAILLHETDGQKENELIVTSPVASGNTHDKTILTTPPSLLKGHLSPKNKRGIQLVETINSVVDELKNASLSESSEPENELRGYLNLAPLYNLEVQSLQYFLDEVSRLRQLLSTPELNDHFLSKQTREKENMSLSSQMEQLLHTQDATEDKLNQIAQQLKALHDEEALVRDSLLLQQDGITKVKEAIIKNDKALTEISSTIEALSAQSTQANEEFEELASKFEFKLSLNY